MFTNLRRHFGTAGLLVAVVALIAALGGSAIAANAGNSGDATASAKKKNRKGGGNVNKLIKREARKFSKQFSLAFAKRFPGPIGPQGVPGLPGAPGSDGDDGSNGSDGSNGKDGKEGPAGKSAEVTELVAGECANEEGGAEVKEEGAAEGVEVCNGEEGPEGSPWVNEGTLPEGATLTGTFSSLGGASTNYVPVSFGIPLQSAPDPVVVKGGEDKSAEGCDGTVSGGGNIESVAADPGTLCLYVAVNSLTKGAITVTAFDPKVQGLGATGTDTAGTLLEIENAGLPNPMPGIWAVGGDTPAP